MANSTLGALSSALLGYAQQREAGDQQIANLQYQKYLNDQQRPEREARTDLLRSQADAAQIKVEEAKRAQVQQRAGQTLLQIQNDPAWLQSDEAQHVLTDIANNDPGSRINGAVGFKVMGRQEAEAMGMGDGIYDQVLMNRSPDGQTDEHDRLLVPLRKNSEGVMEPFDGDGDGEVDTYSAREMRSYLETLAGAPTATANALSNMNTGQAGASSGSDVAPAAQPQTPVQTPTQEAATAAQQRMYGARGASAAIRIPAAEGESDETAVGRPMASIPEGMSRTAKRVARGQGISPAQAKKAATDDNETAALASAQPTPRAVAGASANVANNMRQRQDGQFEVRGGRRPTNKQLSSAVLLKAAGIIDKDDLIRYADTGVLSKEGTEIIQQGMQGVVSRQNNAANNAQQLRSTAMQQAGADRRNAARIEYQAKSDAYNRGLKLEMQNRKFAQDDATKARQAKAKDNAPVSAADTLQEQQDAQELAAFTMGNSPEFAERKGYEWSSPIASIGQAAKGLATKRFRQLTLSDYPTLGDMSEDDQAAVVSNVGDTTARIMHSLPKSMRTESMAQDYTDAGLKINQMMSEGNTLLNKTQRLFNPDSADRWELDRSLTRDPLLYSMVANKSPLVDGDDALEKYQQAIRQPMQRALADNGMQTLANDVNTNMRLLGYVQKKMAMMAAEDGAQVYSDLDKINAAMIQGVEALANQ